MDKRKIRAASLVTRPACWIVFSANMEWNSSTKSGFVELGYIAKARMSMWNGREWGSLRSFDTVSCR
jgi:hypothetical protein